MNLVQMALIKSKGYTFDKTERRGYQYVAVAIKNGKTAEAGGSTIRDAESRLVLCVTRNDRDERSRQEERFLQRMQRRYGFPWRARRDG